VLIVVCPSVVDLLHFGGVCERLVNVAERVQLRRGVVVGRGRRLRRLGRVTQVSEADHNQAKDNSIAENSMGGDRGTWKREKRAVGKH
jgi:hypothetical protein